MNERRQSCWRAAADLAIPTLELTLTKALEKTVERTLNTESHQAGNTVNQSALTWNKATPLEGWYLICGWVANRSCSLE